VRLGRLAARVAGGEIEERARGLLLVVFLQGVAWGGQVSYFGLWALRDLGASQRQLGLALAVAAVASVTTGFLSGRVYDRIGRRGPTLAGSFCMPLVAFALGFVAPHVLAGFVLMALVYGGGGVLYTCNQATIADLFEGEARVQAFASLRVVQNAGVIFGPLLAALFLHVSWKTLFLGTGAIALVAALLAVRLVPATHGERPDAKGARAGSLSALLRSRAFVALFAAATLTGMVYIAYETLLPISLVQTHGVSPTTWGILLALNPIAVVLFQLRLSRKVANTRQMTRLAIGIAAMALPFLLVQVSTAIPLVVALLLVFVVGEMLWVPTSQALVARIAPAGTRGAFLGAIGSSQTIAASLGPLIGLQLRSGFGDSVMWIWVAAAGAAAIASYALAVQYSGRGASPS
jgi:MFS family permease